MLLFCNVTDNRFVPLFGNSDSKVSIFRMKPTFLNINFLVSVLKQKQVIYSGNSDRKSHFSHISQDIRTMKMKEYYIKLI